MHGFNASLRHMLEAGIVLDMQALKDIGPEWTPDAVKTLTLSHMHFVRLCLATAINPALLHLFTIDNRAQPTAVPIGGARAIRHLYRLLVEAGFGPAADVASDNDVYAQASAGDLPSWQPEACLTAAVCAQTLVAIHKATSYGPVRLDVFDGHNGGRLVSIPGGRNLQAIALLLADNGFAEGGSHV